VTDFGIARSGASQMTEAGSIVGTAQYLSPEQARGAPVDPRSDLYSLGIVMYEMLTGRVPFTGDAPVEIAMKHLSAVPDPPSKTREEVPHDLDAVVMRALAKDPDHRYASAEEMDADLARVARGLAVSRKTEEAMTQVLAGAGATAVSSAQTMVARPRVVTPPAPPAYRPQSTSYEYREPPRRRSVWPWLLGLLALVIAGGAGYLLYDRIQEQLADTQPIAVTDVGLLQKDLARQKLEAQGFQVRVLSRPSQNVPAGQVVSQDPVGGDKRAKGSTVRIWVSTGIPKTTVPDVRHHSLTDAIAILYQAGLTPTTFDVNSDEPPQTVTAQSPKPGETVPRGSKVRLNVSQGPKQGSVPNVVGQPFANASSAIRGAGFGVERRDVDDSSPKGQVVAQDPPAGSVVTLTTKVTLSVSRGPQTSSVPAVTGLTRDEAEQLIQDAGFDSTVFEQDVSDPSQDGLVLSQDPSANKKLEQGSTVTLVVGRLVSAPPAATTTQTTPTTSPTEPATTTTP
jgi:serine/threonine-protein kinase